MTNPEFETGFDILYNNITSNQAPGLNQTEMSFFLNKGQLEVLKNHLNPKGNKYGEGIDDSSKRQIEFTNLIETKIVSMEHSSDTSFVLTTFALPDTVEETVNVDNGPSEQRQVPYLLNTEPILSILNETVVCTYNSDETETEVPLVVIPLSYDEYSRELAKPFSRPNKRQAWRISFKDRHEIILPTNVSPIEYHIRYVRIPRKIDLSSASTESSCELPEILHQEILERAVELAKLSWEGTLNSAIAAGQNSE